MGERAGHAETAAVARRDRLEEEALARTLDGFRDAAGDLSLEEEGITRSS